MIKKVFCFAGEKDGVKNFKIDKGSKKLEDSIFAIWNQVFGGIKYHIKKINHECKKFNECKGFPECEEFFKFKVDYDDDFDRKIRKINLFSNNNCY